MVDIVYFQPLMFIYFCPGKVDGLWSAAVSAGGVRVSTEYCYIKIPVQVGKYYRLVPPGYVGG